MNIEDKDLTRWIQRLVEALAEDYYSRGGDYKFVGSHVSNEGVPEVRVIVAVGAEASRLVAHFGAQRGQE